MSQNMFTLKNGLTLRNGSYKIIKVLGQGGFGITYLAEDKNLDRLVAIKEFFPKEFCVRDESTSSVRSGVRMNDSFIERLKAKFLKEARNLAHLDYRGIIRVYTAFEENDTAYYVMEYIEGENLKDIVQKNGPLPVDRALKYIRQVGESLEYIHKKHLNHLDVKPANILLRKNIDQTVLIDFGLSKQYDKEGNQTSTTPTGISHGYAPAEQYNEGGVKEFSPRTDLYSLAATFYYLLTGKVPPRAIELLEQKLQFPPHIPPHIVKAVSQAMSLGKSGRHESVRHFLNELNDHSSETHIPVEAPTRMQMPRQTPRPGQTAKLTAITETSRKPPLWKKHGIMLGIIAATIAGIILLIGLLPKKTAYLTTPDLTLLGLHGPVEAVSFIYDNNYVKIAIYDNNDVKIAEINPFEVDRLNFYNDGYITPQSTFTFTRNTAGEIDAISKAGNNYAYTTIEWKDGRPYKIKNDCNDGEYVYNKDNILTGYVFECVGGDFNSKVTAKINYLEFDEHENWTKCTINEIEESSGWDDEINDYKNTREERTITVYRNISYRGN